VFSTDIQGETVFKPQQLLANINFVPEFYYEVFLPVFTGSSDTRVVVVVNWW